LVQLKEQEREADDLSALILYRSGLDLDKARGFLIMMARGSGRRETGMPDLALVQWLTGEHREHDRLTLGRQGSTFRAPWLSTSRAAIAR
jgi:hypothetical protein